MSFSRAKIERLLAEADKAVDRMAPDDPLRCLVSGLSSAASRFRDAVEYAVQAMYVGTLDGRIVTANPAFATLLGYGSVEDMLPIESFALQHYVDPAERDPLVAELLATGRVVNREVRLKKVDGTPVWGLANIRLYTDEEGQRLIDGVTVDITARKQAEEALRDSERHHRRILETAGEGFIFMDQDLVIHEVNEAYCKLIGMPREDILGRTPIDLATPEFAQFMTRNRGRLMVMDYRTFEGSLLHADGHVVPILVHANTLRCENGAPVGNVAFVADLTESKKALALAAEVQRGLLPSHPPHSDILDVAGRSVPSQYAGGDYFDYLDLEGGLPHGFRAVVGDVTGHGLDAALFMSTARGFIRMRSVQPGSLAEITTDLNMHITRDAGDSGRFMTLFLLEVGPDLRVHWVRAGHDPGLVYDPVRDAFRQLDGRGVALGILEDAPFACQGPDVLAPGELLAVGTDGIWEARDGSGEMFGRERFKEVLRGASGLEAAEVVQAVFDALRDFAGPVLEDDATLVVIKARNRPPA